MENSYRNLIQRRNLCNVSLLRGRVGDTKGPGPKVSTDPGGVLRVSTVQRTSQFTYSQGNSEEGLLWDSTSTTLEHPFVVLRDITLLRGPYGKELFDEGIL